MSNYVYVDPVLSDGGLLRIAVFVNEMDKGWVIQSDNPKTGNIDEYEKIPKEEVLTMFPELGELFDLELEDTISFRKGINSGKWYDFYLSK